ncbi:hypothetical protein [Brevibacterium jeotgali]|uniref:Uncharacterized protein n=1 Tax=Brevibacterium jeotgali TaxID=1262550 RepID=A0A2H1L2Q3_9MICO|nr:hypothetical protein [Brevibacterium jeotgali]TWC02378.1 hypothetical protein FB108_1054 [Brevibacterium jeotgali]SMY11172.1 hypothetical protein BJEO58_00755 [Brevibacterium jeotgali]
MITARWTSRAARASAPVSRGRATAIVHAALLVLAPIEIATAVLIATGVPLAVWIPIVVGVLLVATVAAEVVLAARVYLRSRRAGSSRRDAVRQLVRESVPAPVVRFARFEILLWVSAGRWVARRPLVPADGRGVTFHRHEMPVLLAFAGLGVVEIVVAHWLLPWPVARIAALLLGVMGVLWVLGFIASLSTRPHWVTDRVLGVRVDSDTMIRVDLSSIAVVTVAMHHSAENGVQVVPSPSGRGEAVSVARHGQTNISVSLEHGTALDVPGHGVVEVTRLSFWVDEPESLLELLPQGPRAA